MESLTKDTKIIYNPDYSEYAKIKYNGITINFNYIEVDVDGDYIIYYDDESVSWLSHKDIDKTLYQEIKKFLLNNDAMWGYKL